MTTQGWICARCQASVNPAKDVCPNCLPGNVPKATQSYDNRPRKFIPCNHCGGYHDLNVGCSLFDPRQEIKP